MSRWSNVLGLPVSVPAFAVYIGILINSCWITSDSPSTRDKGWRALLVLTALVAGAALWFIAVQIWIIEAICPWCMTDHLLGLLLTATVYAAAPRNRRTHADSTDSAVVAPSRTKACVFGMLGTAIFVGLQVLTGTSGSAIARLPADENADTGPGENRQVGVLQGSLQITVAEEPIIGSPDAPHLVLMLFDYACPHCRHSHEYFLEIMAENPGKFALVALPTPLDGKCNPVITSTKERFKDSCEVARFALAVWYAQPASFGDYDRWLFETSSPRERLEAKNKARELVGDRELFDAILKDPRIVATIARNVTAYGKTDANRLPVITSPGLSSIIGKPDSKEQLWEILSSELIDKPPANSPSPPTTK